MTDLFNTTHSETEARMQELLSSFTIGTIFTPTQRHTFRTSYYNNTTSVQSDALPLRPRCAMGCAHPLITPMETHGLQRIAPDPAQDAAGRQGSCGS